MTCHDLFHGRSEFSMTYMFSSFSQSIVKIIYNFRFFSSLWRIKCVLVLIYLFIYFLLKLVIKTVNSQNVYRFSITFHDTHFNFWNFRPGKWNYKIPWRLSRFSTTRTNPVELCSRKTVRFSEQIMSADKYPSIRFRAKWRLLFIYSGFRFLVSVLIYYWNVRPNTTHCTRERKNSGTWRRQRINVCTNTSSKSHHAYEGYPMASLVMDGNSEDTNMVHIHPPGFTNRAHCSIAPGFTCPYTMVPAQSTTSYSAVSTSFICVSIKGAQISFL